MNRRRADGPADSRKACLLDASNPLQIPKPWQSFIPARTQQILDFRAVAAEIHAANGLYGYPSFSSHRKAKAIRAHWVWQSTVQTLVQALVQAV
jgi:hypothetical protein